MQPFGLLAGARRAYINQRMGRRSPEQAAAHITTEFGTMPPALVSQAAQEGERAIGLARRMNRQRLTDQVQYAAYRETPIEGPFQARILIAYRRADGSEGEASQWWTVDPLDTRADVRARAAAWLAIGQSDEASATLIEASFEAVL